MVQNKERTSTRESELFESCMSKTMEITGLSRGCVVALLIEHTHSEIRMGKMVDGKWKPLDWQETLLIKKDYGTTNPLMS